MLKVFDELTLKDLFVTGVVTSPNYPGDYPHKLKQTHTIQVEQGLILSLQFTAFNIEYCTFNCQCDHLIITDGDGTTLMGKSCGSSYDGNVVVGGQKMSSNLPAEMRSKSNVVKLVFDTNDLHKGGNATGWSLSWRSVTPGECEQYEWIFLDKINHLRMEAAPWCFKWTDRMALGMEGYPGGVKYRARC